MEEIDHAQKREHPDICLAKDAFVVRISAEVSGAQAEILALLECYSIDTRRGGVLDAMGGRLFNARGHLAQKDDAEKWIRWIRGCRRIQGRLCRLYGDVGGTVWGCAHPTELERSLA